MRCRKLLELKLISYYYYVLLSSNSSLALPLYLLIYFPLPKVKSRLGFSAFLLSPVGLTWLLRTEGLSLSLCLVLFLVKCFQSSINLWKKLSELLDFSLSGFHLYPFKYIFLFSVWDQSVLGISSEKILSHWNYLWFQNQYYSFF